MGDVGTGPNSRTDIEQNKEYLEIGSLTLSHAIKLWCSRAAGVTS